jgi:hypothetical protein
VTAHHSFGDSWPYLRCTASVQGFSRYEPSKGFRSYVFTGQCRAFRTIHVISRLLSTRRTRQAERHLQKRGSANPASARCAQGHAAARAGPHWAWVLRLRNAAPLLHLPCMHAWHTKSVIDETLLTLPAPHLRSAKGACRACNNLITLKVDRDTSIAAKFKQHSTMQTHVATSGEIMFAVDYLTCR